MESESNSIEVVPTNQNIGESGDVTVGIEGGSLAKNGENNVNVGNIIVKEDIGNVIPNEAVPDNDAGDDSANDSEDTEEGYDSEEQDPAIEESIQNITDAAATGDEAAVENNIETANNLIAVQQQESNDDKQCWVCFGCEQDDPSASWVHPCRCRGTTKWVHQACIQRWVDEKQKGNTNVNVECPQCGTAYVIRFPRPTFIVSILDSGDMLIQRMCPIITGGVCVGSICWTMVTFGAVTLMQTVGHDRSLVIMERADPLLLLVVLPLVPVGLIIGQMIRWEETVLKFLRMTVPKTPVVRSLMPSFAYQPERRGISSTIPPMSDPISYSRDFCGALFFPTVATFLGATLYKNVPSQFKRTLLGGLTFAAIKGILKIYHKQHAYVRQCQKQILDYTE